MEVLPVDAIVYNQAKVNIENVIAPPYDVIDSKYRQILYDRSDFNIVRLILSKEADKYGSAKRDFEVWKEKGILIKIKKPAIFYVIQKYTNEKGRKIERKGFIARNKIEDFSCGKILPHEYTMGRPKQDRLNLVNATGAFFSQIFMVYEDKTKTIENTAEKYINKTPYINVSDDNGVQNTVYLIDDIDDIRIIQKTMEDKILLIADGHHRYETSMNYAKLHPENENAKYVMSYFTNAADENLIIYPTHRIIEKSFSKEEILSAVIKHYDIIKTKNREYFLNLIEEENQKQITTGLIIKGEEDFYVLKLKKDEQKQINAPEVLQNLDLVVLHDLILKDKLGFTNDELMAQNGIKYEKKEDVAFNSINNGACAVFIMAYPKMKDIISIASSGERMPQKSTYFYPKLLSGIVINPL